ncbi:four-carbon acid sugar kinase family protein [Rhodoferax sp.]|uniref:four-carbon acid sugar kinase family protein n=1 Tax=Rhodoferax sp. TaxID=50421 RepID=UPI002720F9D9|nr:four-carbon acid sugar kinase family protein [Rhodoferax sp.]MDO9143790.1 four-carbon acid sugar kinase family protein [Rhodoferax sp.]MDP3193073.1 four-carbon acid sugar kinase family protein [Rhodoferax sp.]MDP3336266.1 four-carbon acid sugar kinase family protein [Rhodoferax sp.]MDP3865045.1 four-carbon acid sugar kinase family protein [Rhodoferax sp.]
MKPWHILADDLTGALDSAAAWADAGEVPVFLDAPETSAQPVQVVATGTRDVPPASLPALLTPSLDWLVASGSAFKKIDSLLRGNTFAEIAWLMRSGRFAGVVFAPAFPAQGRFTAQGQHWVAPPHQPDGPRTHEHPGTLVQAFADVGLTARIPSRLQDCLQEGGEVVIPDLLSDADMDQLASLAHSPQARSWLWCGSAGLAWALARQAAAATPAPVTLVAPPTHAQGLTLVLTASRHPVLREQLRQLPLMNTGTKLLDLAEAQPLEPAEAQARLTQRMHTLVATQPRPDALVVVGGDTLLALCRACGVRGLQAGASPRAGWGRARLVGGLWDGLHCYSRSGAFGPPDDLRALLAALSPTSQQD